MGQLVGIRPVVLHRTVAIRAVYGREKVCQNFPQRGIVCHEHQQHIQQLFAALSYELRLEGRGFAYLTKNEMIFL